MTKRKPCSTTTSKLAGYDREAMLALLLQHNGVALHAARAAGVSESSMRRRLKALEITREEVDALLMERDAVEPGEVRESDNGDGTKTITAGYRTLDEAIEGHGIDLDAWQIVGDPQPNSFTGPIGDGVIAHHHQWKFRIRERGATDPASIARRFDERLEMLAKKSPKVRRIRPVRAAGTLILEPSIYDFHLGMLADEAETGEPVTLESAMALWRSAVDLIVQKMPPAREIDRIVFPFGNDMAHINDRWGATGNGTPQDRAAMLHQIAEAMETLYVETFDTLKQIAPVEAICVPGNHGPDVELFVARYLDAWFRNDENVTVDAGRNPYKFRRWGNTCIGFTHGKGRGRRIPTKDLCGQFRGLSKGLADGATWLEWHVGHEHHKEVEEHFGVRYRMVPSLVASDSWHHHSGYHGAQRAAEVFCWDRRYGEAGKVPVSLLEIQDAAGLSCAA